MTPRFFRSFARLAPGWSAAPRGACAPAQAEINHPSRKRDGFPGLALALAALLGLAAAVPQAAAQGQAQEAELVTIVAFGDSLTQGYGLPAAQGFAPQLEAWLKEQNIGPVRVVNSGVSGETTAGGLARLDWAIQPEADAVILELGANDALRGLPAEKAKENLDEMLRILTEEKKVAVLLAGMRSPGNWGAEYKTVFDGMYAELAEKHDVALYPFFMAGLADDLDGAKVDPALFLPNDFHPSAKGVAKIVEGIGPSVLKLIEEAKRKG